MDPMLEAAVQLATWQYFSSGERTVTWSIPIVSGEEQVVVLVTKDPVIIKKLRALAGGKDVQVTVDGVRLPEDD